MNMKMKIAVLLAATLAVQSMQACIVSILQPCGGGTLTSPPLTETDGSVYYLTCNASPGQLINTAYNCAGLSGSESATINCNTTCNVTRSDAGHYGEVVTVNSSVPTHTYAAHGDSCNTCGG
jgi:hypothetical protein